MIRDLQGQEVYQVLVDGSTETKTFQADLSHLPSGVYITELRTRAGRIFSRLMLR
jgi:hypothetical protein